MKYPHAEAKFEQRGLEPVILSTIYRNETNCEQWVYGYEPRKHQLKVRTYRKMERTTPRHKWVVVEVCGGNDSRQDTMKEFPKPPEWIRNNALDAFYSWLRVE